MRLSESSENIIFLTKHCAANEGTRMAFARGRYFAFGLNNADFKSI